MNEFLVQFIEVLSTALYVVFFGRFIMSIVSPGGRDQLSAFLDQITEPILSPIRSILPRFGMFDLSPLAVLLILYIVRGAVHRLL